MGNPMQKCKICSAGTANCMILPENRVVLASHENDKNVKILKICMCYFRFDLPVFRSIVAVRTITTFITNQQLITFCFSLS